MDGMGSDKAVTPVFSRTLADLLRELAKTWPDSPAAFCEDRVVSFARLCRDAEAIAVGLAHNGVRRGDAVGLLCSNRIEWLEIAFGAMMAGAVLVPISTWSTPRELDFIAQDAGIGTIFALDQFVDRDFRADLRALQANGVRVFLIADSDDEFETCACMRRDGDTLRLPPGEGPSAGDDALLLYTSGSTSVPKGVRLKHFGIIENGFNIGERQGLRPGDRVFLSAPLFWAYGGCNALPATFTHGGALILLDRFDPATALRVIERDKATGIYLMPAMTAALLRHPDFDLKRTASLRTGLTIGSSEEFVLAVEKLGVPELCNVYGSTETYGNCAVTWHDWPLERRATSQGPMLPGQELRIRDPETGSVLPSTENGLMEVRGYITTGYSGASSGINPTTFTDDGFYRTGDIGKLNEHGAVVFAGRSTEMIKRAGINVSPAEIETVLIRFGGVSEAAVVGVPDQRRGEAIVAFVVPGAAATITVDALLVHLRAELSKYKVPDRIELCSELPLTTTGKLHRARIKESAAALMAAELEVAG
jgi:fatty-acyl-CoA synthase